MTEYLRANPGIRKEYYRRVSMRRKWRGNWWKALERDKFTCQFCGHKGDENQLRKKRILVHHLDGEGETGENHHHMENLVTVCYDCHEGLHGISLLKVNGEWLLYGKIFGRVGLTSPPPILDIQPPRGRA